MSHTTFHESGIREIDFDLEDDAINHLKNLWQNHVKSVEDYPASKFSGRGIVMCAGGVKYFTCAWVAINNLQSIGCKLPIELWYADHELSEEAVTELQKIGVICKKFNDFLYTELRGFSLKPLAIIHSQFKEILFLDADNNCLVAPDHLFETSSYLEYGAVF